jgi:hypothetical protein
MTREELDYFLNHIILGDYQRWIEENKSPFFVEDTPATSRDWIIQMMLKTSLKATYECTRAMGAADFRAEMARIILPALVIPWRQGRIRAARTRPADGGCAREQRAAGLRGRAARAIHDPPGAAERRSAGLHRGVAVASSIDRQSRLAKLPVGLAS